MPKIIKYGVLILIALAMIPPALIARVRAVPSDKPRIHYIQDMDNQPKGRAQHASTLFADGRMMRPPVPGTIARGELWEEDYSIGAVGGQWVSTFPRQVNVDMDFIKRGQERFNIYCTPCHGYAGYGDGAVHVRAERLMNQGVNGTTWTAPKSLHEKTIAEQPIGQTFNTITNGVRNMPGYSSQIPIEDRWAIVAYVKALQRSQSAQPGDAATQRPRTAEAPSAGERATMP